MKKNLICLACCSMMALLVACQGGTPSNSSTETPPVSDTTADSTPETPPVSDTTADTSTENDSPAELENLAIDWQEEELFAIVYVHNYETPEDYASVAREYLSLFWQDIPEIPEYIYDGYDHYLLIPRYPEDILEIYDYVFTEDDLVKGDILDTVTATPYFILSCNVSDLFPNVLLEVNKQGELYSFSPFLSLKDGTIAENPYLKDLTIYPYPSE